MQRHVSLQGSGIVQFALPEDAERAVREYNDKALLGRKVQVTASPNSLP